MAVANKHCQAQIDPVQTKKANKTTGTLITGMSTGMSTHPRKKSKKYTLPNCNGEHIEINNGCPSDL